MTAPAYVRRARQLEEAFEQFLNRCRQQREELLCMVRTRIGALQALAGEWAVLRPWLREENQVGLLRDLHTLLRPRPCWSPRPTSSCAGTAASALQELCVSVEYFNRRWQVFLQTVDRDAVDESRDAYNRYYLLEKECALRSARLARQGFYRQPSLTVEELAALLPPLPVPQLAE